MTGPWHPSIALISTGATATGLTFGGVALHRPDLIALAVPLLVWLAFQIGRPGTGELRPTVRAGASALLEDQATIARARITAPDGTDFLTASFAPGEWLNTVGPADAVAAPERTAATDVAAPTDVEFVVAARRWSRTTVGTVRVTAWAGLGLFWCSADATGRSIKIIPYRERFSISDALPVTSGIVGTHRSRRPGEGTDLAGIRPFQVGDRLKRINWPVSLRTGTLHVTATVTDLDATVMIVIDSSTDLVPGADPTRIGGTLDTAVHAGAALAEHYLRAGDRVGILDDGQTMRTVLPAAGRPHLDRIVDALLDVDTALGPRYAPVHLARVLARVAPRAMVIMITPLLERARPEVAVEIARAGHPVLVIDSLGDYSPEAPTGSTPDLAWRLQRLQHDYDIDRLADAGIPVAAWGGAGSLNTVLARLSRAAAAPRVIR